MSKANIYCDTCDELYAEVDWDNLPDWHNTTCCKCGDILINDADMEMYYVLSVFIEAGLAKHPRDDNLEEGVVRATVSTRHGEVSVTEKEESNDE